MAKTAYDTLSNQVEMLSYADRLRLLNKIVQTLNVPQKAVRRTTTPSSDDAFGIWKDRDVTTESIRQKAWGRG